MQRFACRPLFGILHLLAFSVAPVQSSKKVRDHFLIGNATSSDGASVKDSNVDAPWNYKGIEGGPACIVESSNASDLDGVRIQVFIRHDNIRSMSFGTGYDEHSSVLCMGDVADVCTAWTSNSKPRESNRTCAALVENCACEPDTHTIVSRAHSQVSKDIQELCYQAPDHRDLYVDPYRILIIGLNTGALPMYLMANCRVFVPGGLKVSVIEPDSRVIDLAHDLFGFSTVSNVAEIEKNDPKQAILNRLLDSDHVKYDIVVIDLVDGSGSVPESIQGPAFLEGIDRLLRPGSRVIHYVPSVDLNQTKSDYFSVFGKDHIQDYLTGMTKEHGPEHILVAHGPPILSKSGAWAPTVSKAFMALALFAMLQ